MHLWCILAHVYPLEHLLRGLAQGARFFIAFGVFRERADIAEPIERIHHHRRLFCSIKRLVEKNSVEHEGCEKRLVHSLISVLRETGTVSGRESQNNNTMHREDERVLNASAPRSIDDPNIGRQQLEQCAHRLGTGDTGSRHASTEQYTSIWCGAGTCEARSRSTFCSAMSIHERCKQCMKHNTPRGPAAGGSGGGGQQAAGSRQRQRGSAQQERGRQQGTQTWCPTPWYNRNERQDWSGMKTACCACRAQPTR
jgi:hypothetical protein